MIIIKDIEQNSPEWFEARAGIPTASRFDKIVTSKGERSKSRTQELYQLAGERILGTKPEGYTNAAMERGIEMEAEARVKYEFDFDCEVEQVALCYKDEHRLFSCSPDGLVGDDGGVEIKCPSLHTHVEYMVKGKLPTKYFQQVQGSLFITGRKWWDFVSYYPGMPLFRVRAVPDKVFHEKLATELNSFCEDLAEVVEALKAFA